MHAIQFGNDTILYDLKWSDRRKTIAIAVDQYGVTVTAPTNTSQGKIDATVYQKASWIRSQQKHFEEMNEHIHVRDFLSGEKLPYLGRQYSLKVQKNDSILQPSLIYQQGKFIAHLPIDTLESNHREILYPLYKDWVHTKGEAFIKSRIGRFAVKLQEEPSAIKIKEQQQRWGSCTANGQVLINWRILLAPVSIIDYVLAHELSHLIYMDHSKAFWDTLGMLVTDYEERKEWLRVNGKTLYI